MELKEILQTILQESGSDVYILPGAPVTVKVRGILKKQGTEKCTAAQTEQLITEIYALSDGRDMRRLLDTGDDDFSFSLQQMGRFRCSAFRQRGSLGAVLRAVPFAIPDAQTLCIPPVVMNLTQNKHGMVLVTGPAGSGKSTTLACMIDRINTEQSGHIITIEDPIEFLHAHRGCLITQREVSRAEQLRAMANKAGHLLLSTLHTIGAAKTIDRIVDAFPGNQQQQVRVQLSMILRAVVSQQLIPGKDGQLIPAFEVMVVDPAVASLIREGKSHQLDNMIFAGTKAGMQAMDSDILRLYRAGRITRENALAFAVNPEMMEKRLI